MYREVS
jgi:16S rRNA (cytosine1402-N4)-methyltransferase